MATRHTRTGDLDPASARTAPDEGSSGAALGRHLSSLAELRDAVNACRRCSLWRNATQGVPGEGAEHAEMMFVGEQPGDAEDLGGHPFIGPAGAILDHALIDAGIDRRKVFVTNAVKHFKFEPRGKRRLHSKPNATEIEACRWWLTEELKFVTPKLIVALGATAARSVLGHTVTISALRGLPTPYTSDAHVWVTVHPSYLLRIPDDAQRRAEYSRFVSDLEGAKEWLARGGRR
ncbi:MAG: UdgX family uracil-DNA binding protein [Steroidobacteraceae bacterium]|nr:UdgX family uracil-DNA binding protein [Steroidobacteraceae bacterium]